MDPGARLSGRAAPAGRGEARRDRDRRGARRAEPGRLPLSPTAARLRRGAAASASRGGGEPPPAQECLSLALLYSVAREPREIPLESLGELTPSPDDLLWVDLTAPPPAVLAGVLDRLALPQEFARLATEEGGPQLRNFGAAFGLRVLAARMDDRLKVSGETLAVCAGSNVVLTCAVSTPDCVRGVRERQRQNVELGAIQAESFVAALLDAKLATYYDALAKIELEVERLELALLSRRPLDVLDRLRRLRQASSNLRRLLTAHRDVYGGMARPDFRPTADRRIDGQFIALDSRFERALDVAEHGRDLIVGTFELFSTRAAMSTNHTMQVLTFVTVLIGGLAVVAGVLGMNFAAPFFESGGTGFWIAVGAMLAIALGSLGLARWRGWL